MKAQDIKRLETSSKRSALLSLLGMLIFISSLVYASFSLSKTSKQLNEAKANYAQIKNQVDSMSVAAIAINERIDSLKTDEARLTEFALDLIKVTERNESSRLQGEINWNAVKSSLLTLPSGKRKLAVMISILMVWKEIPFKLGESSTSSGFDSTTFLKFVLEQAGVPVKMNQGETPSRAMMRKFRMVNDPLPGDLMFYKGQVGSFGLIYISKGPAGSEGTGIGTLQAISPLGIYSEINTADFPFIGYYRVEYDK